MVIIQLNVGPQVRELHIDFLLEEEFYSNPQFLCSFLDAAAPKDVSCNRDTTRFPDVSA